MNTSLYNCVCIDVRHTIKSDGRTKRKRRKNSNYYVTMHKITIWHWIESRWKTFGSTSIKTIRSTYLLSILVLSGSTHDVWTLLKFPSRWWNSSWITTPNRNDFGFSFILFFSAVIEWMRVFFSQTEQLTGFQFRETLADTSTWHDLRRLVV